VSRASAWRAVAAVIARARAVRVWALMRFRARAPAGTPGRRARTSAGRVSAGKFPSPVRNGSDLRRPFVFSS
jgi:hypothetical protein